jgi:hypothetical protein
MRSLKSRLMNGSREKGEKWRRSDEWNLKICKFLIIWSDRMDSLVDMRIRIQTMMFCSIYEDYEYFQLMAHPSRFSFCLIMLQPSSLSSAVRIWSVSDVVFPSFLIIHSDSGCHIGLSVLPFCIIEKRRGVLEEKNPNAPFLWRGSLRKTFAPP